MLCWIAEIIIVVFGIVILVKGEVKLSPNRVVPRVPSRIIGGLLVLAIILGQGGAIIYGAVVGAKKGVELAKQGKQFKPEDVEALQAELVMPAIIINVVGHALPIVVALVIAMVTAVPARRKKPRRDLDDDDDDDRPRRRKGRDDEEEDDDRPRRRRNREDDEADEEDRPRRRRVVDDEDDDEAPPRRRPRDDDEEDDDREERIKKR